MDIISYSAASKVSNEEKYTRYDVLGEDIRKSFPTLKKRIDEIDKNIGKVTEQADRLIIQNAINIMKAHAKLNTIAKSKKYHMHDMIFDDLLDLSGIDVSKSKNYTHDAVIGSIKAEEDCIIYLNVIETEFIPSKAIFYINLNHEEHGRYYISRDGGNTWEAIKQETLFYFSESTHPIGQSIHMKLYLPEEAELLDYGVTWA